MASCVNAVTFAHFSLSCVGIRAILSVDARIYAQYPTEYDAVCYSHAEK